MKVKLSLFFISFIFLLFISIYMITTTTFGLKLLLKFLPGTVTTKEISGSLWHGWDAKQFDYKNDQFHACIGEMHLSWQALALLKQNLIINELSIKNATIDLFFKSSEEPLDLSSVDLPLNIFFPKVSFDNIKINYNKNNYLIKKARLSSDITHNILHIKNISVETPDFLTSGYGTINLHTWSNIRIYNNFNLITYPEVPISTIITGDQHSLALHSKSKKWLGINIVLQNFLEKKENMTIQSTWHIDATKSVFKELSQLNGRLLLSGEANGRLLAPKISGKIFAKDIRYDRYAIGYLEGKFSLLSNDNQNLNFILSGKNVFLDKTLINSFNFSLLGTLKKHSIILKTKILDNYFFDFFSQGSLLNDKNYLIKNATLDASPLNLKFYPINITLRLDKNGIFYQAKFHYKNQDLSIIGNTQIFSNFKTVIQFYSKAFTLINTKAYKVISASDLKLDYNDSKTTITGVLDILRAHIFPIDFSNTTTLSTDIVYVNNKNEPIYKKDTPSKIFLNVLVKLEKLTIGYKGVKAEMTGKTTINKTPTSELIAHGQLKFLNGTYKAYGQELTIQENSSLSFFQQIDNPRLNITASKQIKVSPEYITLPSYQPYLIAGVQVTGTADEPNIHLFSIPAGVNQQDILSYLIFGFPQNQLTNSQATILWNALSMMGSGQSNFSLLNLQRSIQKEFGFSEFGFGNSSEYNAATQSYETGTAFVVGKRITDKLTATYNVGLLVPVNILYLRYKLANHWTLQSDSSSLGNGGDIFYTIQRD